MSLFSELFKGDSIVPKTGTISSKGAIIVFADKSMYDAIPKEYLKLYDREGVCIFEQAKDILIVQDTKKFSVSRGNPSGIIIFTVRSESAPPVAHIASDCFLIFVNDFAQMQAETMFRSNHCPVFHIDTTEDDDREFRAKKKAEYIKKVPSTKSILSRMRKI